jgi:transcriptional regulator of arginine metabolism
MKARRQHKILEIIKSQPVETQEELAISLRESGFEVTQATVSRDIKELGLVKVPDKNNLFRYASRAEPPVFQSEARLKRLFRDSVIAMDISENLLIIKTHPGGAQALASAADQAGWDEILGTVGGDDTILVVVKSKQSAPVVFKRFEDLNKG